jgi:hypothetical protein
MSIGVCMSTKSDVIGVILIWVAFTIALGLLGMAVHYIESGEAW